MTKLEEITQELLNRIPNRCKYSIDNLKYDYNTYTDREARYETLLKMNHYLYALEDAGLITEYERNVLRQYILNKAPKEED